MKYLITGLPRSRTAWMAQFMPNCVHEPITYMKKIEDIKTVYADHDGISDSGLGFWLDWILHNVAPRTLIIDRDLDEVEKSLAEMNLGLPATNYCELLQEKLDEHAKHPLVLRVPYEALGNMRVMQKVWWHLLGHRYAFDEARFKRMNAINITVSNDHLARAFSAKDTIVNEIMPLIRPKELSCQ